MPIEALAAARFATMSGPGEAFMTWRYPASSRFAIIHRSAFLLALATTSCAADTGGEPGAGTDGIVDAHGDALRSRWARWSSWSARRRAAQSAGTGASASGAAGSIAPAPSGAAGMLSTAAGAGGAEAPSSTPEPSAPEPASGNRASATSLFAGSRCPSNAPTGGACSHYGDQCTYDNSSGTHYCTCVPSSAQTGTQGWSCR